jgi:hypothetical protein
MFYECNSLKYLNLYFFQVTENNNKAINDIFYGVPSNTTFCIKDNETKNYFLSFNKSYIFSDTCYNESNTNSDLVNNEHLEEINTDKNNISYSELSSYINIYSSEKIVSTYIIAEEEEENLIYTSSYKENFIFQTTTQNKELEISDDKKDVIQNITNTDVHNLISENILSENLISSSYNVFDSLMALSVSSGLSISFSLIPQISGLSVDILIASGSSKLI